MPKKMTFQEIYNYIQSQGYQLISTEYENAHKKLKIKCPKGHEFKITYANFQQGHRCSFLICSNQKKE